jgi:hypothetical protein
MGTGDFFLLTFKNSNNKVFRIMIDCGCINASKVLVKEHVEDLIDHIKDNSIIDLLIVTHEHADHMNGFEYAQEEFKGITFRKVWLAWTESKEDPVANEYRGFNVRAGMALRYASDQLKKAVDDPGFNNEMALQYKGDHMLEGMKFYAEAVNEFVDINLPIEEGVIPTMEDKLRKFNVVTDDTLVEYLEPSEVLENIEGLTGIRVFVLGPPREKKYLNLGERHGEGYEQREQPSAFDFSFIDALCDSKDKLIKPFKSKHVSQNANAISKIYKDDTWRKIDHDWLNGTSELALRYERNINNTSLALAFQFVESEKVLLFPGDAEFGSWLSWHEKLSWEIKRDGKKVKIAIGDLLENTVCYKVSHHLSQNGTPAEKGLELLKHPELVAFVTLDLDKIQKVWRHTMPNDHIGAGLLRKTKGKVFFVGKDTQRILDNITTDRVNVSKTNISRAIKLNGKFADSLYIEYEIAGD